MHTEDGHIIYKCLEGDSAAFGLLVDKYKGSIFALAYSKLCNFHDAEDVTQEVFIKAFKSLRSLRRWDNFLAWLYSITSNLCKNWIRSHTRRVDHESIEDQDTGVLNRISIDSHREDAICESVREALGLLPEIYRQVLTLHYLGGMSIKEIARFLGVSSNAIGLRLSRARAQLKEEMIAMMSKTYETQRLPVSFTFRIVEMVKKITIHSTPKVPWLPWGLTIATGFLFGVFSFNFPQISFNPTDILPVRLVETKAVETPVSFTLTKVNSSIASEHKTDGAQYSTNYTQLPATSDAQPDKQGIGQGSQMEEAISAGIKYYDSKIKTVKFDAVVLGYICSSTVADGNGKITRSGPANSRTEYTLAYEGSKEFFDTYRSQISDPKLENMQDSDTLLEYVFDGERSWFINKGIWEPQYMVINGRSFGAECDPRFWVTRSQNGYDKDTLDKRLTENGAKFVDEETVELNQGKEIIKEPCYLMSYENKNDKETCKLWISKRSFRLVKEEFKRNKADSVYMSKGTTVYKQFPGDIWYPVYMEWDSSDYFPDGHKYPWNVGKTMLSNIEINTDVSKFFKLNAPPDARILDFNNGKWYIASEIPDKITPLDARASIARSNKQDDSGDMALITAGTFKMGDGGKEVNVDVFYMDKYEVTNKEYAEFLNAIGKNQDDQGEYKRPFLYLEHRGDEYWGIKLVGSIYEAEPAYADHPVSNVSYHGAVAYAKWKGKRLPTEAEWEKSARGGLVGKEYPWGDTISHSNANYEGTGDTDIWLRTAPVGSFPPNGYGLYDMAGNVSEMCSDPYDPSNPLDDNNLDKIVTRGGSWGNDYWYLRCAFRFPSYGGEQNIGFRCAKDK